MIKKFLAVTAVLVLTACPGRKESVTIYQGHDGRDGRDAICTASRQEIGVLISCNDGSNAILLDGSTGPIGLPGADGDSSSCSVAQEEDGALISCSDGSSAFVSNGNPGNSGHDGNPGNSGHDGTSCTVSQLVSGALITCGNSSATVYNGTNGTDGSNCGDGGSSTTITTYSSSSCTNLGDGYYGKSGSGQYAVYTSSSCSNSSKVATMDDSSPTFWLSASHLLVFADPSSVRKLAF